MSRRRGATKQTPPCRKRDDPWANRVYRELGGRMTSGTAKARFDASVQFRFDGKL